MEEDAVGGEEVDAGRKVAAVASFSAEKENEQEATAAGVAATTQQSADEAEFSTPSSAEPPMAFVAMRVVAAPKTRDALPAMTEYPAELDLPLAAVALALQERKRTTADRVVE